MEGIRKYKKIWNEHGKYILFALRWRRFGNIEKFGMNMGKWFKSCSYKINLNHDSTICCCV